MTFWGSKFSWKRVKGFVMCMYSLFAKRLSLETNQESVLRSSLIFNS